MTYNEIQSLVGALGFPITCCVVMFIQNGKLQKTLADLTVTLEKMRLEMSRRDDNNDK